MSDKRRAFNRATPPQLRNDHAVRYRRPLLALFYVLAGENVEVLLGREFVPDLNGGSCAEIVSIRKESVENQGINHDDDHCRQRHHW